MNNAKFNSILMATINKANEDHKKQSIDKAVEEGCEKRITGNGWNEWREYICSSCQTVIDGRFIKSKLNYCPNCGKAFNKK